ncbi:HpcH/HpaI aldolase family protein [Roseicyclus marinus]|uniref:2,4-dihydroxyhept-2-ene-1,7-dioic acid aldolase n=1 Tax=Roseicyclus marinus TaxID=2161673 RepID=A0AA48HK72_9RHOB|nr:2,4-dihydroxyhept-2-ene-1,7-dioic acid aldolase [Roseicyclus marinus]
MKMSYEERLARRKALKTKLMNREPVFGGWVSYPDAAITETFAMAGFDFIAIDMEHTTISLDEAKRIISSAQAEGACCFPRPVSHSNDILKPLLEAGADGLFIQMVETPEQVRALIDNMKFPPVGRRSYGVNRAHGYGFDFDRYITEWNDSSTLVLQIESIQAVENIDALLAFPEVDGVMVGPYDISGSLGVPGQTNHPKVREAGRLVIEAAQRAGKSCCTQIADVSVERVRDAFDQGFTFVILGSDLFILWKWAENMRTVMAEVRG